MLPLPILGTSHSGSPSWPPRPTPLRPAIDAVPRAGEQAFGSELIGRPRQSVGERGTSWLRAHRREAQVLLDVAAAITISLTFTSQILPADVMFHVVFVMLTVQAFLFGLRATLLRIGIVSIPLLVYANAAFFGLDEPEFDLAEWPLMFVIAVLVAWMADRVDSTAKRYASLFRQASERLLTVEEDERRRIALELHDGVGQVLTAMTLTLDSTEASLGPPATAQRIGSARKMAATALAEVRHLAHRMRPARLEERGLTAAIRDLAGQSGFPVRVHVEPGFDPTAGMEPTMTVGIYRIVQEALANAARHSGASTALVSLGRRDRHLVVVISDDGRGFDPGATVDTGIGLAGMYERAELLGGSLSIKSATDRGTRVTLDMPLGSPAV